MSLLWITACNGAGLSGADSLPPTGVYQASSALTANDCQPLPVRLSGNQFVRFEADYFFTALPAGPFIQEAYEVSYDGLALDGDFCGARRSFTLEIVHLDEARLDVRRTTNWTQTALATPGCGAPVSDCSSIEDFHFTLVQPCAAPCEFAGDPGNTVCSCP